MFSKVSAAFVALALCLTGCSGEKQPAHNPVAPALVSGSDCMGQLSEKLQDFANARMNDGEVSEFWNCVAKSIGDFERLTEGSLPSGNYTPEAINGFLKRYFLKSDPLPSALLHELMQVKRVLLLGSNTEVAGRELVRAQELLMQIKAFCLEINPYVPVLFRTQKGASDRQILQASRAFQKALDRFSDWLTRNNQTYEIAHLERLLTEIVNYVKPDDEGKAGSLEFLNKLAPVLPDAKKILLGGDGQVITGHEWAPLVQAAGEVFHAYLAIAHGLDSNLDVLATGRALPEGLKDVMKTIRRAVEARESGEIPLAEWNRLFSGLVATGELPDEFTVESLDYAWRWLLSRTLKAHEGQGLAGSQVNLLEGHIDRWLHLIDLNEAEAKPDLQKFPAKFREILEASAPLHWDGEGRLVITPDRVPSEWTKPAVQHLIWNYVILDWIKSSYTDPGHDSLTSDEFQLAVEEVLPVLQGFGWMKDSETTIFQRLLREADLFTLASNGDKDLDMSEAVRYLAFVMASFRTSEIWLDLQKGRPCEGSQADCVRQTARLENSPVLDALPRLKVNMFGLPEKKFIKYMRQSEEILFEVPKDELSVGDLLQVFQLFQYVETFIQRYDVNLLDTIDLWEATTAFETYGPTLTDLLQPVGMPEEEILPFFTFMMKYGDTPFTMWGGSVAFNHWKWHVDQWSFEAERSTLMSILNQLSKL